MSPETEGKKLPPAQKHLADKLFRKWFKDVAFNPDSKYEILLANKNAFWYTDKQNAQNDPDVSINQPLRRLEVTPENIIQSSREFLPLIPESPTVVKQAELAKVPVPAPITWDWGKAKFAKVPVPASIPKPAVAKDATVAKPENNQEGPETKAWQDYLAKVRRAGKDAGTGYHILSPEEFKLTMPASGALAYTENKKVYLSKGTEDNVDVLTHETAHVLLLGKFLNNPSPPKGWGEKIAALFESEPSRVARSMAQNMDLLNADDNVVKLSSSDPQLYGLFNRFKTRLEKYDPYATSEEFWAFIAGTKANKAYSQNNAAERTICLLNDLRDGTKPRRSDRGPTWETADSIVTLLNTGNYPQVDSAINNILYNRLGLPQPSDFQTNPGSNSNREIPKPAVAKDTGASKPAEINQAAWGWEKAKFGGDKPMPKGKVEQPAVEPAKAPLPAEIPKSAVAKDTAVAKPAETNSVTWAWAPVMNLLPTPQQAESIAEARVAKRKAELEEYVKQLKETGTRSTKLRFRGGGGGGGEIELSVGDTIVFRSSERFWPELAKVEAIGNTVYVRMFNGDLQGVFEYVLSEPQRMFYNVSKGLAFDDQGRVIPMNDHVIKGLAFDDHGRVIPKNYVTKRFSFDYILNVRHIIPEGCLSYSMAKNYLKRLKSGEKYHGW